MSQANPDDALNIAITTIPQTPINPINGGTAGASVNDLSTALGSSSGQTACLGNNASVEAENSRANGAADPRAGDASGHADPHALHALSSASSASSSVAGGSADGDVKTSVGADTAVAAAPPTTADPGAAAAVAPTQQQAHTGRGGLRWAENDPAGNGDAEEQPK